jgi:hypothetical protein
VHVTPVLKLQGRRTNGRAPRAWAGARMPAPPAPPQDRHARPQHFEQFHLSCSTALRATRDA